MSSQSVSDLATRIRALTETSRNLRRVIADNEPKLGRVDDLVTHTSFRSRWTGYSYNYMDVINDSRAAAMRLSSSVEFYLALRDEVNGDLDLVPDLIEELNAMKAKPHHGVDFGSAQFAHLARARTNFEQLGLELASAVRERTAAASRDVETAQTEVTSLEKQLRDMGSEVPKFNEQEPAQVDLTTLGRLLSGADDPRRAERYATQKKLAEAQNRLARANSTVRDYEMADSDGVLQAIEGIRTNLGTQLEQLRVFPDLTQKLTAEVNEYQAALQNIRQDPSAENQRALKELCKSASTTSGPWREVANVLAHGYANSY